uniref:Uncharacterized protein n=1 Tax=Methanosarcina mazei TaxID=2209 RepID=O33151_METMZ|nr:hypothetical protein [Methanosarcina mazei]
MLAFPENLFKVVSSRDFYKLLLKPVHPEHFFGCPGNVCVYGKFGVPEFKFFKNLITAVKEMTCTCDTPCNSLKAHENESCLREMI